MTYVEKCLYGYKYKANLAELEVLYEERKNLMSLHGQTYEINNSSGEQDPVGNIVNQGFTLDKRISQLEKRVKPVDKLINDLKGSSFREQQMCGILRLRYIEHEDKEIIKKKIGISDITLWRRTKDLMSLAKRYFPSYVK